MKLKPVKPLFIKIELVEMRFSRLFQINMFQVFTLEVFKLKFLGVWDCHVKNLIESFKYFYFNLINYNSCHFTVFSRQPFASQIEETKRIEVGLH